MTMTVSNTFLRPKISDMFPHTTVNVSNEGCTRLDDSLGKEKGVSILVPFNSAEIGGRAVARIVASIEVRKVQKRSMTNAIQNLRDFFGLRESPAPMAGVMEFATVDSTALSTTCNSSFCSLEADDMLSDDIIDSTEVKYVVTLAVKGHLDRCRFYSGNFPLHVGSPFGESGIPKPYFH
jgi:hypothetical protein